VGGVARLDLLQVFVASLLQVFLVASRDENHASRDEKPASLDAHDGVASGLSSMCCVASGLSSRLARRLDANDRRATPFLLRSRGVLGSCRPAACRCLAGVLT